MPWMRVDKPGGGYESFWVSNQRRSPKSTTGGYWRSGRVYHPRQYKSFKRRGTWRRGGQIIGKPRTDEGDYRMANQVHDYGQGSGRWDMDTEDREEVADEFYRRRGGRKSLRDEWNS